MFSNYINASVNVYTNNDLFNITFCMYSIGRKLSNFFKIQIIFVITIKKVYNHN